jgi:hypothetical protein
MKHTKIPEAILVGAYGRSYVSKKDAIKDWEAGKDFRIQGGPYCSNRDYSKLYEVFDAVKISTLQGLVAV